MASETPSQFSFRTLFVFLLIPLALVLAINLQVDVAKPMWLDELIVSRASSQPHLADIWNVLTSGQSPHPPLNFLVVRCLYSVFGVSELTTRLPSTVGFVAMEVCLFFFVSKRSNAAFGTVAMLFPLITLARSFAVDAKPYASLLGWTGIALICWRNAAGGRWRPGWLLGLGIALACAASSHFFGVVLVLPILAGEAVRALERRRFDWAMGAVVLMSYTPLALFIPIMRAGGQVHGAHPWQAGLNFGFIFSSADQLLAGAASPLLLCVLVAAVFQATAKARQPSIHIPVDELAAAAALALLPLIVFVGARLAGVRVMELKYLIQMVVGVAILFAWGAYSASGGKLAAGVAMGAILGIWGCRAFLSDLYSARASRQAVTRFSPPPEASVLGPLPIVLDKRLYMLFTHYAKPEIADRIHMPIDPEASLKYFHSDAFHRSALLVPGFFGPHVEKLADFQASHHRFLIYEALPNDTSWMLEKYKDDGARIDVLQAGHDERWYLVTAVPR